VFEWILQPIEGGVGEKMGLERYYRMLCRLGIHDWVNLTNWKYGYVSVQPMVKKFCMRCRKKKYLPRVLKGG
jgi:hypothetical protein